MPRNPTCFVCDGRIRIGDAFTERVVLDDDGARVVDRGHRACLEEGVDRWNREGRPYSGPLEASRRDGWRWHTEPSRAVDLDK